VQGTQKKMKVVKVDCFWCDDAAQFFEGPDEPYELVIEAVLTADQPIPRHKSSVLRRVRASIHHCRKATFRPMHGFTQAWHQLFDVLREVGFTGLLDLIDMDLDTQAERALVSLVPQLFALRVRYVALSENAFDQLVALKNVNLASLLRGCRFEKKVRAHMHHRRTDRVHAQRVTMQLLTNRFGASLTNILGAYLFWGWTGNTRRRRPHRRRAAPPEEPDPPPLVAPKPPPPSAFTLLRKAKRSSARRARKQRAREQVMFMREMYPRKPRLACVAVTPTYTQPSLSTKKTQSRTMDKIFVSGLADRPRRTTSLLQNYD
jgi:hypothetical protein